MIRKHHMSLALALSAMLVVACTTPTAQAPTVVPPVRRPRRQPRPRARRSRSVSSTTSRASAPSKAPSCASAPSWLFSRRMPPAASTAGRCRRCTSIPKGDATQALQLATQLAQQDNVDVLAGGIFSPECLGVQGLAERLGLVYLPLNGCANQDYTAKSCSRNTFRVYPAGRQTTDPVGGVSGQDVRQQVGDHLSRTTRSANRTWRPARPRSSAPAASTWPRFRCRWVSRT